MVIRPKPRHSEREPWRVNDEDSHAVDRKAAPRCIYDAIRNLEWSKLDPLRTAGYLEPGISASHRLPVWVEQPDFPMKLLRVLVRRAILPRRREQDRGA